MGEGLAFPKAYGLWAKAMLPNDILGVAYLKQLQDSSITPYTIQRTVGYHDTELQGPIASAKAIRLAANEGYYSNEQTPMAEALENGPRVQLAQFYPYLRTLLLTMPASNLKTYFLFCEGIEPPLYSFTDSANLPAAVVSNSLGRNPQLAAVRYPSSAGLQRNGKTLSKTAACQ